MTVHRSWTLDRLVEEYTKHQRRTRGLRPRTLRGRARLVQMLVRAALGEDPVEPSRLAPADVVAFITSLRGRFSPASMQTVRSTLRSFFRFLRFQGFCGHELEAAVPAVAHWRLATLPRALTDQQVGEVLASFDTPRPCRQRDRAICAVPVDLGATARRGGFPAPGRHRLARRHYRGAHPEKTVEAPCCRCLASWGRRWSTICGESARRPTSGVCS